MRTYKVVTEDGDNYIKGYELILENFLGIPVLTRKTFTVSGLKNFVHE